MTGTQKTAFALKFCTISILLLIWGCAGRSLNRIDDESVMPSEIPKEVQKKFEVQEATNGHAKPEPAEKSVPKKKSKSEEKKPEIAQEAVFEWPERRADFHPIWPGEKMVYEVTYFGVAGGEFTLELLSNKMINGRKVYHAKGNAVSSKLFSLFYRVNDTVESYFDFTGLFSHRFEVQLDESKQTRKTLELNDSEKAQTFYWNRWNHYKKGYIETKESKEMPRFPQDSLSALYYTRSLPLKPGDVFTFPVVSESKTWEAVVTVVRREWMYTPMGRVRTIVLQPDTKYEGVLKKKGNSFFWLTDDDRRILVRLEAKVKIGSVVATLKKFEPGTSPK